MTQKMSEAALRRWQDPKYREHMSTVQKGKPRKAEHRAAISAGLKRYFVEHPESRQQRGEALKAYLAANPGVRSAMSDGIRRAKLGKKRGPNSPQARDRQKLAQQERRRREREAVELAAS